MLSRLRLPKGSVCLEFPQQARIGWRKREFGQLIGPHPFESGAAKQLGFTLEPLTAIKIQAHGLFRVSVHQAFDQRPDGDLDPEFLA